MMERIYYNENFSQILDFLENNRDKYFIICSGDPQTKWIFTYSDIQCIQYGEYNIYYKLMYPLHYYSDYHFISKDNFLQFIYNDYIRLANEEEIGQFEDVLRLSGINIDCVENTQFENNKKSEEKLKLDIIKEIAISNNVIETLKKIINRYESCYEN